MPQASASECVLRRAVGRGHDIGASGGDRAHQRHQHPHPGAGLRQALLGQHDQQYPARAEREPCEAQRLEALQADGEGDQIRESRHQGQHQGDDARRQRMGGKRGRQHRQHHREHGEAGILPEVRPAQRRQGTDERARDQQRNTGEERDPEGIGEDREGHAGRELVGREDAAIGDAAE